MCGITGIINKNSSPEGFLNIISSMTAALGHRGPDGNGHLIRDNIALGNSRLSIIDIKSGQQPLSNEDGKIWITFNGEIYNYKELQKQLLNLGHQFKTNSDTETIVHAYEEWGERCVEHLRGMFAFGIADFRQRKIFLARDHFGIKPLYYLQTPQFFAFASELQAFKVIPGLQLEIDLSAIDQYLLLRYIPDPLTPFKEIKKLSPANSFSISFSGKIEEPQPYWELKFSSDHRYSEQEWIDQLDQILRESIQAHLVADVPVGAFLSGGVDSNAIIAYMAQVSSHPLRTFTIDFEEKEFSESKYAQLASETWQTEHHVEVVKPDALKILPDIVRHYGEPFGDSSAVPAYYLSKLARQYVSVALSGDGGDEAFAGYNSHMRWLQLLNFEKQPFWKKKLYRSLFPQLNHYYKFSPLLKSWFMFKASELQGDIRRKLWRPEYSTLATDHLENLESIFEKVQSYSNLQKVQSIDIQTYLPFTLLTKIDRVSMLHGLEVRTPFVDIKVMEFAATIPESLQFRQNKQGKLEGKVLLKKLLERYYPYRLLHRPKMGFSVPLARWIGPKDAGRQELYARLLGKDSTLLEYFNPEVIETIFRNNHFRGLWLLLFLEEWLRQNRSMIH